MGLFNMNSGFWRFVNRALDVLLLNLLWIVFSLPVITIGASTCAAFYVTMKMVDEEEGYVARMFVKAFKENFKQGTLMWLFTAPCIYADYLIWQLVIKGDGINFIVIVGAILYTAIIALVILYSYPLIARYKNSLRNIIKNAFGVSMLYFKRTLFLLFLVALEVAIIFWNRYTLIAGAFIGPEFIIYTISAIAKRIFQKIEKSNETPGGTENSGTINQ
ncbi:MAG: YesL family protein [Treponema sp.]|nr:YesL family protein [Treponema sp.]